MLLFVTLDKTNQPATAQYDDGFISPTQFRWQSQNRTTRNGEPGRRILEHAKRGIGVHLFLRRSANVRGTTQPFIYCGNLRLDRSDGERPITVVWTVEARVPDRLHDVLKVPHPENES